MNTENQSQAAAFMLRGGLKQYQCERIIFTSTLPLGLVCVLEPTRKTVLEDAKLHKIKSNKIQEQLLQGAVEPQFLNTSRVTLATQPHTPYHSITRQTVSRGTQHA